MHATASQADDGAEVVDGVVVIECRRKGDGAVVVDRVVVLAVGRIDVDTPLVIDSPGAVKTTTTTTIAIDVDNAVVGEIGGVGPNQRPLWS